MQYISQPQTEALPAIQNLQLESKIKEYVNQVDCYQDVEIYDGEEKYTMVTRDLVIQTQWIECKKVKYELYEFEHSIPYTKLEEQFSDCILVGIRAGARDDRPTAGVHVSANSFFEY